MPVDVTSTLPDGTEIDGVDELKAWLLGEKKDAFAASLIKHLFAYALGRDVHFADDQELADILAVVQAGGYRMRSVIRAIATRPVVHESLTAGARRPGATPDRRRVASRRTMNGSRRGGLTRSRPSPRHRARDHP